MPAPVRFSFNIPVPVIGSIVLLAATNIWTAAAWKTAIEKDMEKDRVAVQSQFVLLDSRMAVVEKTVANNAALVERVKGVEVNIDTMKEQTQRIEQKLDTALERRR